MKLKLPLLALLLPLFACVTVNVYFPAAAAERAADRLICDIYGIDCDVPETQRDGGPPEPDGAFLWPANGPRHVAGVVRGLLDLVVAPAYAQQPDLNISTPAIAALEQSMERRHAALKPYYGTGAVGLTHDGLVELRDPAQVPLRERNSVKKLVADENRDRNRLYAEIAEANGHPEWERDIRGIFAERWVARAPGGWWYEQSPGKWRQK